MQNQFCLMFKSLWTLSQQSNLRVSQKYIAEHLTNHSDMQSLKEFFMYDSEQLCTIQAEQREALVLIVWFYRMRMKSMRSLIV